MRKALRQVHLDLVAGLVSFTMTCPVYLLASLPLAGRHTAQALLVLIARAGEQQPYSAQPSVSLGGPSVTQRTWVVAAERHPELQVDIALRAGIANEGVPLCGTKNLSPVLQHWVSAKKKFECRRHGRTGARQTATLPSLRDSRYSYTPRVRIPHNTMQRF